MYDPVTFLTERKALWTLNSRMHRSLRRGLSLRHMAAVDDNNGLMGLMIQPGPSLRLRRLSDHTTGATVQLDEVKVTDTKPLSPDH